MCCNWSPAVYIPDTVLWQTMSVSDSFNLNCNTKYKQIAVSANVKLQRHSFAYLCGLGELHDAYSIAKLHDAYSIASLCNI